MKDPHVHADARNPRKPSVEEQTEAWNAYAEAKRRADKTLRLADGIAAVHAWKVFANLFLEEERRMPLSPLPRNTVVFPVHKTRPPGAY